MAANQANRLRKWIHSREKQALFKTNRRVKRQNSIANYIRIHAANVVDVHNNAYNTIANAQYNIHDGILGYYGELMQWFGSLPGR